MEVKNLNQKIIEQEATLISEPGFDPGTCGLWAHHASAAPLWFGDIYCYKFVLILSYILSLVN